MDYSTFTSDTYAGGAITKADAKTFYCKISIDLHTKHSAPRQTTEAVYQEALLSGAGSYDRTEFLDAVNLIGASINVRIVNGVCTFTLQSIAEKAPALLSLFAAMIEHPTFAPTELTRIKQLLHNELVAYEEEARNIAVDMFTDSLYEKTDRRYVDTPKTVRDHLKHITKKDLQQLHKEMRTTTWTVTVGSTPALVGATQKLVEKLTKHSSQKTVLSVHATHTPAPKLLLHSIPSKQNIDFSIGGVLPLTLHDPEYLPFVFGLSVLGKWGGFTGRLMSTVREKEGLTYGIYARTETVTADEHGYWRIMTFFAPEKAKQGLTSTLREITKIHERGITKSEYERFKVILATQQALLMDSLTGAVNDLHGFLCNGFSLEAMQEKKAALLEVRKKDVNEALRLHLDPATLSICGAGPVAGVKKELQAIYPLK